MQPLKKYFTEGLIQVAIVLSLAGMHVDVDPYLHPPDNINIQNPDLTHTMYNSFQNSPDGYGLHIKNPNVEATDPVPRLLHWVRSLQRFHIPAAQLEAWLVHSESDNSGMTIPSLTGTWDGGDELMDMDDSASLTMRMGGGLDPVQDDGSLGVVATLPSSQMDTEDIKEEVDEGSRWQQELLQDQLLQGQNQYLSLFNEDNEEDFMVNSWQHANPFYNPMTNIQEGIQCTSLQEDSPWSTEECLQLLDAGFSLEHDQYLADLDPVRADEDPVQHHVPLPAPVFSQHEPVLDLEEQWQDVLAVLGPQYMNPEQLLDSFYLNDGGRETGTLENPIQQNLSLYQPTFHTSHQISFSSSMGIRDDGLLSNQNDTNVPDFTNGNLNNNDQDIMDFLLSPTPDSSNISMPSFCMEEPSQLNLSGPLLKESMLDGNGVFALALENGFSPPEDLQKDQIDSDSGLSLDDSQSPVSPSRSESSCCSSSSSSSSLSLSSSVSSTSSVPEEGAVGYTPIKEEPMDEEGAVGGYTPEQNKTCYTDYLQFQYSPWLEHIGHDHTYNQPQYTTQRKPLKEDSEEGLEYKLQDKLSSRDEKRARALRIPFSTDYIINLPVEEFNELLAKHCLSEVQLALIRDIRRRGKNKVAAQNCRRRKLDILQDLERSVAGLQRHRARLLREKLEVLHSVSEMKQRLNDLNEEVRSRLREVERIPCPAMDFTLQPGNDNHVSKSRRTSGKKQKDKE